MQKIRILQAVVLMIIVALAASCAASKEYSSKLFSPRDAILIDSQSTSLRFLELDSLQSEKEGWVSTDNIMGRDTGRNTLALDKLSAVFPAVAVGKDSTTTNKEETTPVYVETKPVPAAELPVAKNYNPGEVRNKRTREK